ncbi:hypothetical protein TNCV_3151691 [Trichonephila clavipes]|nr:hypothetical protein TNCV_3151691 [Trichonephila clavipes]
MDKVIDKIELYMGKASTHTSKSTAAFFAKKESETGIKSIDGIRVKPNYEFCTFGILKRTVGNLHLRTLNSHWKPFQEEWSKIYMTLLGKR